MKKERLKQYSVSQLKVGDIFARNATTREAFKVENILKDGTVEAKIRGKFQLYPTKFKSTAIVTYLRTENNG